MKKIKLTSLIFIALILGILVGWLAPDFARKMHVLAEVFLRMVKMIIAPLLFATLVIGIAGHDDAKGIGRLGLKTIAYFEVVTTFALGIGLAVANVFKPWFEMEHLAIETTGLAHLDYMVSATRHSSLGQMLLGIFPTSIVQSMAEGNLLQIVVFSIFFALAIRSVGKKAKPVLDVLNSVASIMFKFTEFVMWFAPIGIFGAIAYTLGSACSAGASEGFEVLRTYLFVIVALYLALAIFVLFVLLVACLLVKISFTSLIKALWEPALLAFTTASSEAALPKAMDIMEKFGVPRTIVGFVMPTGYTFNLDGSTLYLALAVIFSTQIAGYHLSVQELLAIMVALMFTSKGIAGVPRVALIVLAGTLTSFNIPTLGVAILLGIDQILDMGRTAVNLIGNCVATVVIARWEKQFDYGKMKSFVSSLGKEEIVEAK